MFREPFRVRKHSYVSLGYEPMFKSMHQTIPVLVSANLSQLKNVNSYGRNVILVQKIYWSSFQSQWSNASDIDIIYN